MRRENSSRRRAAFREPRKQVLIVCGGTRTEPDYFDGLKRARRNPAVQVKVLGKGIDPEQLVTHAHKVGSDFDEVWCVVDTDEFDIAKAVKLADKLKVRLAVSNPCFELWLLLHFCDHRGESASYRQLLPKLIKHVPGYDKCRLDFDQFDPGVAEAVRRAERLDPSGRDHGQNPSTGVWKLVRQVLPD
ncbi:RloB family protein [Kutzneria kofuensis]|uniref:RloB-like protein n=1 Tax=Kutzneria kofuensis TaxID=103725 RepID=A0A7W9KLY9_9PSEU|nr:RloB family protein [Kutzneria kofuensis]MBB5894259.1 hypothetical protein [Kutzneria kofuensis]